MQEELDYIFNISTSKFMAHQCFRVLPWWFKNWVFRMKVGPCPSLWAFEGTAQSDAFAEKVRAQEKERKENARQQNERRTSQAQ